MSYDEWRFTFGAKTKAEIDAIPKSYLKEGLSVWNSDLKKPEYVNSYKTAPACSAGMDVVVLIANTGGFANDFGAAIKNTLSTLSTHLATLSGNNYRLGLVLYDWQFNSAYAPYNRVPTYITASGYTSLPAGQKYLSGSFTNLYLGTSLSPYTVGNQVRVTAMTMMTLNNGFAFDNAVGLWGSSVFPYGVQVDGNQYPAALSGGRYAVGAPVGEGLSRVVQSSIAGSWRTGVSKHVIIFNENSAAGNDGSIWSALTYNSVLSTCLVNDFNIISYEYTPATRPNSNLQPGPIGGF
jgi:hypothetical protein